MNPHFFQSPPPPQPPPHGWFPMLPPTPPNSAAFWQTANVRDRSLQLKETLQLAEQMQREMEIIMKIKESKTVNEDANSNSADPRISEFLKHLEDRGISLETQESRTTEAANGLMVKLRAQLEPFRCIADQTLPWEEKSAAVKLASKIQKSKHNKLWRKKKRKRVAEMIAKEHERFNQADQEADEWRAREIAKDIAKRKMEKMKEIAKLKAKEERRKLESELELVLIVQKLQELRSLRIQKLKKQGHFLPEEDDKFLERVQASVEEEERQALASAEETQKTDENSEPILKDKINSDKSELNGTQKIEGGEKRLFTAVCDQESKKSVSEGYDSVSNLPMEFYHYYHGSKTDMGTLIEVRRTWDAYIRPGGSRIPGHWVQPPPPADEIWASYLVKTNLGP